MEIRAKIKTLARKIIPGAFRQSLRLLSMTLKRRMKRTDISTIFQYDKELYWIDPRDIRYAAKKGLHIIENKNKIIGGNWDRPFIEFSRLDVYASFKQRIEGGVLWQETPLYQRVLKQIQRGQEKWGCRNKADLDKRCERLDAMIEDMRHNGYRAQGGEDEITVNIDRDGLLLLNHGRHRLACAKLLEIKKVPIKITARHKKWAVFKSEIIRYAAVNAGKVYAPLPHIDLENIPSQHERRFEIIKNNLDVPGGKMLDIGAHWGYFCHKFEELGFECFAVEQNEECFYYLEQLRKSTGKRFHAVPENIFLFSQRMRDFDVVLALSILHWFIRDKDTFAQLQQFLGRLAVREMFFQPHAVEHTQMQESYRNFSPEEFVGFIIENSCLNHYVLIGEEGGRKIYKIYK